MCEFRPTIAQEFVYSECLTFVHHLAFAYQIRQLPQVTPRNFHSAYMRVRVSAISLVFARLLTAKSVRYSNAGVVWPREAGPITGTRRARRRLRWTKTLLRPSVLKPIASIGHPPAHNCNRDGRDQGPPQRQREISQQAKRNKESPEDFTLHEIIVFRLELAIFACAAGTPVSQKRCLTVGSLNAPSGLTSSMRTLRIRIALRNCGESLSGAKSKGGSATGNCGPSPSRSLTTLNVAV